MMRSAKWVAIVAAALVSIAAGCAMTRPVLNVTDSPVITSKPNPTLDDVGKAILRGGARSGGWVMRQMKPGHMVGTLTTRTHTAVVDITYSVKSYSIKYKDSTDLKYDGTNIHTNYNNWIERLDRNIRVELTAL